MQIHFGQLSKQRFGFEAKLNLEILLKLKGTESEINFNRQNNK